MKYKSRKQYNNFTNCIVHDKQSKITHIEMSLKTIIYPEASNSGV